MSKFIKFVNENLHRKGIPIWKVFGKPWKSLFTGKIDMWTCFSWYCEYQDPFQIWQQNSLVFAVLVIGNLWDQFIKTLCMNHKICRLLVLTLRCLLTASTLTLVSLKTVLWKPKCEHLPFWKQCKNNKSFFQTDKKQQHCFLTISRKCLKVIWYLLPVHRFLLSLLSTDRKGTSAASLSQNLRVHSIPCFRQCSRW